MRAFAAIAGSMLLAGCATSLPGYPEAQSAPECHALSFRDRQAADANLEGDERTAAYSRAYGNETICIMNIAEDAAVAPELFLCGDAFKETTLPDLQAAEERFAASEKTEADIAIINTARREWSDAYDKKVAERNLCVLDYMEKRREQGGAD